MTYHRLVHKPAASSINCVLAAILAAPIPVFAQASPIPERPSNIGYRTVAEAKAALQSRSDVAISVENNWTVVLDEKSRTIWSFAPPGEASYPAVVKRQVVPRGAGSEIETSILCESTKAACDDLVRTFVALTEKAVGR